MIRTKYKIDLQIDEEVFNIEYINPSRVQQEEFKKAFEEYNKIIEEVQDKQNEIEFLNTKISIDTELINSLDDKNAKLKALKEQRSNILELKDLKNELKTIGKKELDLNILAKKRFAVSIKAEQKEALIRVIEEKSISYFELMEEVDKELEKAKEKK